MVLLLFLGLFCQLYQYAAVLWASEQLRQGILGWLRGQTKAPSSASLTRIDVSKLLFHYWPSENRFFCIHSHFVGGEQCSGGPSKEDEKFAGRLREALAIHPPDHSSTKGLLSEYARLSLCSRHRKSLSGSQSFRGFWDQQIHQWLHELHTLYNDGVSKASHLCAVDDLQSKEELLSELLVSKGSGCRQATPQPPGDFPLSQTDSIHQDGPTSNNQELRSYVLQHYQNHFNVPANGHQDVGPKQDFTQYHPGTTTLARIITRRLSPDESKRGIVYAYTVKGNTAYHKIGYAQDVDERLAQWSYSCGIELNRTIWRETHNAKRVERLIHTELQLLSKRRYNHSCIKNAHGRCAVVHNEWFEVDEDDARKVVEYWVGWMRENEPYDDEGELRPDMIASMFSSDHSKSSPVEENDETPGSFRPSFLHDSDGAAWHTADQSFSMPDWSPRLSRYDEQTCSSIIQTEDDIASLQRRKRLESISTTTTPVTRRGSKTHNLVSNKQGDTSTKALSSKPRREQTTAEEDEDLSRSDDASPLSVTKQRQKKLTNNPSGADRALIQDESPSRTNKSLKMREKASSVGPKNNRAASVSKTLSPRSQRLRNHDRSRISSAPDILCGRRSQNGTADDPVEINDD